MGCAPVRRDNPRALAITSIDLAHYGVSRAKDWVSVKCGTTFITKTISCPAELSMKKVL